MLAQDADGLDPTLGHSLASTALDLLAAAETEDSPAGRTLLNRSQAAILRRVRAIVIANLTDPDLSTDRVAELAGISVRYLHKIFSSTGMTLHQWIQDERLKRCYQSLTSPNQRHRTIQDIAFSNGFNDSGYFSHRFSRKYGVSPRSVRNQS
jgi:AraC-like DNA-binding protein